MKISHILIAIMVAALWGGNFIVVKIALVELPPLFYCASRFALASFPFLAFIRKPDVPWWIITGIGLALGTIKFTFLFLGIYLGMSAGLSSLVIQAQVFFTILLSVMLFRSQISSQQMLGMMIAFLGIFVIGMEIYNQEMQGNGLFLGFLMVVGAAVAWAVANLLFRKAGKIDMFSMTIWMSFAALIPMAIISFWFDGPEAIIDAVTSVGWIGISCMAYTVIASTWVAVTLWGTLLRTYDTVMVVPYALLVPVFGFTGSWLILGEQFTTSTLVSSCIVFLGLFVNQYQKRWFSLPSFRRVTVLGGQQIDKAA